MTRSVSDRRAAAAELVSLTLDEDEVAVLTWLKEEFEQQTPNELALTLHEVAKIAGALARLAADARGEYTTPQHWLRTAFNART